LPKKESEKDAGISDIEKFESQKRRGKRIPKIQQDVASESRVSGLFPPLYSANPAKGFFPSANSPKLHS
jgi:hypothetical protein